MRLPATEIRGHQRFVARLPARSSRSPATGSTSSIGRTRDESCVGASSLAAAAGRATSRVQIDDPSPYGESFACRIASSSSSKGPATSTGPKDLLAGDPHLVGHVGQDGRRHEVAAFAAGYGRGVTAGDDRGALVLAQAHVVEDAVTGASEITGRAGCRARPGRRCGSPRLARRAQRRPRGRRTARSGAWCRRRRSARRR